MLRTPVRRLTNVKGALFVCDMQESFRGSIKYFDQIAASTANMVQFAKIMGLGSVLYNSESRDNIKNYR